MVKTLKFTVVTVALNAENVIKKTIESVLHQTLAPYEYIIIDGGSTDNTLKIINLYDDLFKKRNIIYKIISEKDNGIYDAMNKGITNSKGDFTSFLNAGDWYEKNALENINSHYNKEWFDLTYGGLHYIKPNGTIIDKMSRLDSFPVSSRHWNHPSMFLKTKIYKKYYFDTSFKAYADFDLYLKLRRKKVKIRVIDKVITNFVADGVSTNTNFNKVLSRAREKYLAYTHNGYSCLYWLESYGWEILKSLYFKVKI